MEKRGAHLGKGSVVASCGVGTSCYSVDMVARAQARRHEEGDESDEWVPSPTSKGDESDLVGGDE